MYIYFQKSQCGKHEHFFRQIKVFTKRVDFTEVFERDRILWYISTLLRWKDFLRYMLSRNFYRKKSYWMLRIKDATHYLFSRNFGATKNKKKIKKKTLLPVFTKFLQSRKKLLFGCRRINVFMILFFSKVGKIQIAFFWGTWVKS